MKASELNEMVSLMETAESAINRIAFLYKQSGNEGHPLTEKEVRSNEGIAFGSKLFDARVDIPAMSEVLKFIQMSREPKQWGDYLDKANSFLPEGDYSNSVYPPKDQKKEEN